MSTIAERVAAGAAWLDENRPGWVAEIDLNRLVLSSHCNCICGQLWGDFEDAPFEGSGYRLGFNAYNSWALSNVDDEFRALEAEWRRVITERRAAA